MNFFGLCNPLVAEQSVQQIVTQLPQSMVKVRPPPSLLQLMILLPRMLLMLMILRRALECARDAHAVHAVDVSATLKTCRCSRMAQVLTASERKKYPCETEKDNLVFMGSTTSPKFVKELVRLQGKTGFLVPKQCLSAKTLPFLAVPQAPLKLNEGWTVTFWSLQVRSPQPRGRDHEAGRRADRCRQA